MHLRMRVMQAKPFANAILPGYIVIRTKYGYYNFGIYRFLCWSQVLINYYGPP